MRTERGLDRLVFFTDAVSAIAITLLILPLVDSASVAVTAHHSVERFIGDNLGQLFGFVLSFAVVARMWAVHHSLFEHVAAYNRTLFILSLFWALTIVFLPLPTEMLQFPTSTITVVWYIGTMLLSSIALLLIAVTVRRHPEISPEDNPMQARGVFGISVNAIAFLVALIVGVAVPVINFYALLLVLLASPAMLIYDRVMARRA